MRDLRPDRRPDLVPIHDPAYDPTYENRRTRSPDIVPDNPISYAASYAASRAASWTTTRLTLNFYLRPTATSIVRALSASYPILLCLLGTCSPRGLPTTEHCLNERVPGFLTRFSYAACAISGDQTRRCRTRPYPITCRSTTRYRTRFIQISYPMSRTPPL